MRHTGGTPVALVAIAAVSAHRALSRGAEITRDDCTADDRARRARAPASRLFFYPIATWIEPHSRAHDGRAAPSHDGVRRRWGPVLLRRSAGARSADATSRRAPPTTERLPASSEVHARSVCVSRADRRAIPTDPKAPRRDRTTSSRASRRTSRVSDLTKPSRPRAFPCPSPPASSRLHLQGVVQGPYEWQMMDAWLANGFVGEDLLVNRAGDSEWIALRDMAAKRAREGPRAPRSRGGAAPPPAPRPNANAADPGTAAKDVRRSEEDPSSPRGGALADDGRDGDGSLPRKRTVAVSSVVRERAAARRRRIFFASSYVFRGGPRVRGVCVRSRRRGWRCASAAPRRARPFPRALRGHVSERDPFAVPRPVHQQVFADEPVGEPSVHHLPFVRALHDALEVEARRRGGRWTRKSARARWFREVRDARGSPRRAR